MLSAGGIEAEGIECIVHGSQIFVRNAWMIEDCCKVLLRGG